jgi:xylan 1,4-beta-xylosidase
MTISRRDAMAGVLAGGTLGLAGVASARTDAAPTTDWKRGFDNQRIADLGNGTLPQSADLRRSARSRHPEGRRGLLHDLLQLRFLSGAHDLAFARPGELAAAQGRADKNIGSVWAVSLEKHDGRYFLYIPVKASPNSIFVIWADHIDGPWSEPIDLEAAEAYRPLPRGGGGRIALAVPVGRGSHPPVGRWPVDRRGRSSMSMTPGAIPTIGMSRGSPRRGRRSTAMAAGST